MSQVIKVIRAGIGSFGEIHRFLRMHIHCLLLIWISCIDSLSLIDAIRKDLRKTSYAKQSISSTILKKAKPYVDTHLYSIGMFPYHYISKGIFQLPIGISLLETANTRARSIALLC